MDEYDLERIGELVAAPITDEILEQLPKTISVGGDYSLLHLIKTNGYNIAEDTYMAQYDSNILGKGPHGRLFDDKPADALAKLWLYCKEHGLLPKTKEQEDA